MTSRLIAALAWVAALPAPTALAGAVPAVSAPATAAQAAADDERRAALRHAARMTERQAKYYVSRWGVDKLRVSYTNSGTLIRFTYRIVAPALATPLLDRSVAPELIGLRSHAALQVPVMEKVGPLRQAMGAEAGKDYWIVFSNRGDFVRPGDRVNVMIGSFHADGLLVE